MDIMTIILIIFFLVVPIVFLGIAVIAGFKRNLFQSLAKLGMTVFAIGLSLLIARLSTSTLISSILPLFTEGGNGGLTILLQNSGIGIGALKIVSSLVSPIVFACVFSIVSLICLILYIIPKRQLTDTKLEERKQIKEAVKLPAETVEERAEVSESNENQPTKDTKKTWLRVGSVAISVLSTLLVLAHLALPLSYYSKLVADVSANITIDAEMEEVVPAIKDISNHPTVLCYRFVSAPATFCLDSVSAGNGKISSSCTTLVSILDVASKLSTLASEELSAEALYSIADSLNDNAFLNSMLTDAVHEMIAAWGRGESWFGIESINLGDNAISKILFEYLKDCDSVVNAFRLVGDALQMQKIVETEGFTANAVNKSITSFRPEELKTIGNILCTTISNNEEMPAQLSDALSTFVDSVIDGIVEIKQDNSIAEAEKSIMLQKEAEVISELYSFLKNPEKINPEALGRGITESNVVANVFQEITNNGAIKDPFSIADKLPSDFVNSVETGLKQGGVSESSPLHQSVMSFFSKGK